MTKPQRGRRPILRKIIFYGGVATGLFFLGKLLLTKFVG